MDTLAFRDVALRLGMPVWSKAALIVVNATTGKTAVMCTTPFCTTVRPFRPHLLLLWGSFRTQVCSSIQIAYNIGNVLKTDDAVRNNGCAGLDSTQRPDPPLQQPRLWAVDQLSFSEMQFFLDDHLDGSLFASHTHTHKKESGAGGKPAKGTSVVIGS